MSAREELAAVLAEQGWCCSPDDHMNSGSPWEKLGDCSDCDGLRLRTADALLASPALANLILRPRPHQDGAAAVSTPTHPWPTDRPPRPEDWLDWFLSLDYPAQYDVAETVLAARATATRCTVHHHDHPPSSQPCRPRPEENP